MKARIGGDTGDGAGNLRRTRQDVGLGQQSYSMPRKPEAQAQSHVDTDRYSMGQVRHAVLNYLENTQDVPKPWVLA